MISLLMKISKKVIITLISISILSLCTLVASPLFDSIYNSMQIKNDEKVLNLLQEKGDQLSQTELDKLLSDSVRFRNLDIVNKLFSLGADPNGDGGRAIIGAFLRADAISNAFLEHNADLKILNQNLHLHPLAMAASMKDIGLIKLLLENGVDPKYAPNALGDAIISGSKEITELLLKSGANPNAKVRYEGAPELPLMLALRFGRKDIAKLLVEYGADKTQLPTWMRSDL